MDLFVAQFKSSFGECIRFLETHPFAIILIAICLILYAVMTMRSRNSAAGLVIIFAIAIGLFMWGLGCLTGMGFTMSF